MVRIHDRQDMNQPLKQQRLDKHEQDYMRCDQWWAYCDMNHPYAKHPPLSMVALLRLETMCVIASTPVVMIDAALIHLVS